YLDVTGKVPPHDRVVAFLADGDPTKRSRLIDELLSTPEYGQHFARLWADLLIKRDPDNNRGLNTAAFQAWLAGQLNSGAGWDRIVRDMVTATGEEGSVAQTLFVLANMDNRQPSPSKLTGSVGNLFMGIQIQCAECHTHPMNAKWNQNDFWGMAAFFGHTKAERTGGGKGNKKNNGPANIREVEQSAPAKDKKGKANGPTILAGLRISIPDPNDPRKTIRVAMGKYFESGKGLPVTRAPYRPHLAQWLTAKE